MHQSATKLVTFLVLLCLSLCLIYSAPRPPIPPSPNHHLKPPPHNLLYLVVHPPRFLSNLHRRPLPLPNQRRKRLLLLILHLRRRQHRRGLRFPKHLRADGLQPGNHHEYTIRL